MTHWFIPALGTRRGTALPRARPTQVERALRARFPLRSQNDAKGESCVSYCSER